MALGDLPLVVPGLDSDLRADLVARWSQPHRRHHDLRHLREVLEAVALLADAGMEFDREPVDLAVWFHDAVYEIGRDDNEDRSAQLAGDRLADSPWRDEVVRLVLLTTAHRAAPDDVNGAVLSDADLSVLGAEPGRYEEYADAVRREYAEIPDDVFKPARTRILAELLDGTVFHTETGRRLWEDRARANLTAEVRTLTA